MVGVKHQQLSASAWECHVTFTYISLATLRQMAVPTQVREAGVSSFVKSMDSSTNPEAKESIWWIIVLSTTKQHNIDRYKVSIYLFLWKGKKGKEKKEGKKEKEKKSDGLQEESWKAS